MNSMLRPSSKNRVIVSRKWARPNIEAYLNAEEVGARMDLYEFVEALSAELGNPLTIVSQKQLYNRLRLATDRVVTEMKSTTRYVV